MEAHEDMKLRYNIEIDETCELLQKKLQKKKPFSCIYISNWARGLETDLDIWDDIHKEFPDATLEIYYGNETWSNWSPEKVKQIEKRIKDLECKGVTNVGMVGHLKLAEALKNASILLYPCQTYSETWCLAVKSPMLTSYYNYVYYR